MDDFRLTFYSVVYLVLKTFDKQRTLANDDWLIISRLLIARKKRFYGEDEWGLKFLKLEEVISNFELIVKGLEA